MHKLFITTALVAGFSVSAVSAGSNTEPFGGVRKGGAASSAPAVWAGAYVGANVSRGYGDIAEYDEPDEIEGKIKSGSSAIRLGYDWQSGRGVFGVGVESSLQDYRGLIWSDETDVKNTSTFFARAGYDVNNELLVYGLLGYTIAKISVPYDEYSEKVSGLTLGIGAEYLVNENWAAYAEYSYTDLGKFEYEEKMTAFLRQVKLGVNYRF